MVARLSVFVLDIFASQKQRAHVRMSLKHNIALKQCGENKRQSEHHYSQKCLQYQITQIR